MAGAGFKFQDLLQSSLQPSTVVAAGPGEQQTEAWPVPSINSQLPCHPVPTHSFHPGKTVFHFSIFVNLILLQHFATSADWEVLELGLFYFGYV